MNGAHDLGGMHGFGPVVAEPDEPAFHAPWERRAFALTLAMGAWRRWNLDMSRSEREQMPPAEYLSTTYYEHWLYGLERLLVKHGFVSADELARAQRGEPPAAPAPPALAATAPPAATAATAPPAATAAAAPPAATAAAAPLAAIAPLAASAPLAPASPGIPVPPAAQIAPILQDGALRAQNVPRVLGNPRGARLDDPVAPRFRVGQAVVARNIHPTGHTRVPRYVRGRRGVIAIDHGVFIFPDTHAAGEGKKPQHVYSVRFTARELWGPEAPPRDSLHVDLWDDYLEPAPEQARAAAPEIAR
ncbi:MAG TPA: nitrile hydratase subunit beta [Kofleriaceae bacterium]|nr:nitrile hydratase subunit beta [Kofleriaceae bacterium]